MNKYNQATKQVIDYLKSLNGIATMDTIRGYKNSGARVLSIYRTKELFLDLRSHIQSSFSFMRKIFIMADGAKAS